MVLVTYNLRAGGRGRSHWGKVLQAFLPDLFLVQETADPGEHLPGHAEADRARRVVWRKVEGRRWGSAVAVARGKARALDVPGFAGHAAGAVVSGLERPDGRIAPFRAYSLHAPAAGGYARAVNRFLDAIAGPGDFVIGGDFNLSVSARHLPEGRTTSKADLAIQRRLREEFGLINCWQTAHPGAALAQTLRWSNAPSTPYHCDGLFVPAAWAPRLRSCEVIASPDWDALSDHNPVVACFDGPTTV